MESKYKSKIKECKSFDSDEIIKFDSELEYKFYSMFGEKYNLKRLRGRTKEDKIILMYKNSSESKGIYIPLPGENKTRTGKKKKELQIQNEIQAITYTPDFVFNYNGYRVFVEIKGMILPDYVLRRNLFLRKLLPNDMFFELHTKVDFLKFDEIMNNIK